MLNYYKNNVWTTYDTLSKKEWEMRFIPDQQFNLPEDLKPAQRTARVISNSEWHQEASLTHYFNARQGAVLCVSSLTDPEELRRVLDLSDASTVIYLVKCSRVFRHFIPWHWIKRLVFLPPKDRLNRLRSRWVFSPMRYQIVKRERVLEEMLKKSSVISGVL